MHEQAARQGLARPGQHAHLGKEACVVVGVLLEGEPGQRTAAAVVLLQRRVQDAHHAARLQRPLAVEDGIVEHHAPVLLFFGQKVRRV